MLAAEAYYPLTICCSFPSQVEQSKCTRCVAGSTCGNLSQIICCFFTNLSSTSPLQNMATAFAWKPGLIFCLFLPSIRPAKLNEHSTRAAHILHTTQHVSTYFGGKVQAMPLCRRKGGWGGGEGWHCGTMCKWSGQMLIPDHQCALNTETQAQPLGARSPATQSKPSLSAR